MAAVQKEEVEEPHLGCDWKGQGCARAVPGLCSMTVMLGGDLDVAGS